MVPFFLGTSLVLEARTWTNSATKRTLEGNFVEEDGPKVVIKLDTGKTVSVAIGRMIDADQEFIKAQKATPAAKDGEKPAGNENEAESSAGLSPGLLLRFPSSLTRFRARARNARLDSRSPTTVTRASPKS